VLGKVPEQQDISWNKPGLKEEEGEQQE